jgi:hypothetical protein
MTAQRVRETLNFERTVTGFYKAKDELFSRNQRYRISTVLFISQKRTEQNNVIIIFPFFTADRNLFVNLLLWYERKKSE